MANVRQIQDRRKAAANISKVTNTMETISAVRYRQYYRQWEQSIDFYDALAQLAYLIVTAEQTVEHPLMQVSESRDQALIVLGSDRGLCGSYNSNVFRLLDVHLRMAKRFKRNIKLYAKGRKVVNHLDIRGIEIEEDYSDFDEMPSASRCRQIADGFIKDYLDGKIGRLGIIYNRFYSAASQRAQTLTILPIIDLIDDLTTRATVIWPWELDYEDFILSPSAEEIFGTIARMMITTAIQGCFLESVLSEHLGRVVAMRSATDNAQEMIEELTKEYNRARQGQITIEMMDIIGGIDVRKERGL
jgi:F-type H+-transporting ATPase subunit gamma